jgi:hypothetical protein
VGGSTALDWSGQLPSPEAVEALSGAAERRAVAWEAEVPGRVRAGVGPASRAACCQVMIGRRPAADVAAELGLTVGAVHKAAERVKRMVIQEGRDGESPNLPG